MAVGQNVSLLRRTLWANTRFTHRAGAILVIARIWGLYELEQQSVLTRPLVGQTMASKISAIRL